MLLAGTQMHMVTFIFIVLEVAMFFYQMIYQLSRPDDDKRRKWYLILLCLLITYNIAGGLLPDPNIPVPVLAQNIIAYGAGFMTAMYFPFYYYKAFDLKRLRFHAYYGSIFFLFLPFIIFYIGIYLISGDLELVRKIGVIIPFFYSLSLLYSLTIAIKHKYKENQNREDIKEIIGVYLATLPWMSLTIVTYFNASQLVEVSFTNAGLLIMTAIFIRQNIKRSREEYNKLQELNATLTQKVEERTRKLEIINEQRTNTFINLAHELKTPLTLIKNYLGEYVDKHGETKELEIIKSHIDKLCKNAENFFDLEKFNKGFHVYNHNQVVDFSQILVDYIALFQPYCIQKGILLFDRIEEPILVKADPEAINSLITNLIENAIKFTPRNGIIEVALTAMDKQVTFMVKDNGIGIPTQLTKKIFEPYFQISSEKRAFQGMGLGLPLTKKITSSLNGHVLLTSNPEMQPGTEVKIVLPIHSGSNNEMPVENFKINSQERYSFETLEKREFIYDENKFTLLVVEDNISMMNYFVAKLREKYNVYSALNGSEALQLLRQIRTPDLIISDVMMPQMDGFEFAKQITQDSTYNHIPFLFITAKSTTADQLKGLTLTAIDYIAKPFSTDVLLLKIESVLKNRDKQRKAFWDIAFTNTLKSLSTNTAPLARVGNEDAIKTRQPSSSAAPFLLLPSQEKGQKIKINLNDIFYAESFGKNLLIHSPNGNYTIPLTLQELESLLPVTQFIRVHKSYILSVDQIAIIDGNQLFLKNGLPKNGIPLGATYRKHFLSFLEGNKYEM